MDVTTLAIPEILLVRPERFGDSRGHFGETWNRRAYAAAGIGEAFVQDNQSYSRAAGTIRGLHYQAGEAAQAKLVRCLVGAVYDVAVDLRAGSATYGRWVAATLTAAGGEQMYVPVGFAHGFCTLHPETVVAYKVSAYYARAAEAGLAWDDPDLGIPWPLDGRAPILSEKDRALPRLRHIDPPF